MLNKCSYWTCANRIGLFFVTLFAACFAWYFIHPVEQEMHLAMFKMSYLGFEEMNFVGFLLGAIQSYFWAYLAVGFWKVAGCCKKKDDCCCKK